MWFILGPIIGIALIGIGLILNKLFVLNEVHFYGADGLRSGMYAYRKWGIWRIGFGFKESCEEKEDTLVQSKSKEDTPLRLIYAHSKRLPTEQGLRKGV